MEIVVKQKMLSAHNSIGTEKTEKQLDRTSKLCSASSMYSIFMSLAHSSVSSAEFCAMSPAARGIASTKFVRHRAAITMSSGLCSRRSSAKNVLTNSA